MAFWGAKIKSGKPFKLEYDNDKGTLHISQATLGNGSSKGKTVVVCNIGDEKPIYLCSLFPRRMETCLLSLDFAKYKELTFSVIGPRSVHLSGYFQHETPDDDRYDDDTTDDDESDPESESGESFDDEEDEDEDDYGDDETDLSKNNDDAIVEISEDRDGFAVSSSPAKSGLSSNEEFIEKETSGQFKRKKNKSDSDSDSGDDTNNAKRKKDDSVKDGN